MILTTMAKRPASKAMVVAVLLLGGSVDYRALVIHFSMVLFRKVFLLAFAGGIAAQLNFPTSDCVDPTGTAACIQKEDAL